MKLDTASSPSSIASLKPPSDESFALLKTAGALVEGVTQFTRLLEVGGLQHKQIQEHLQAQAATTLQALDIFTQSQKVQPSFIHAITAAQSGARILLETSKEPGLFDDSYGRLRMNGSIEAYELLKYAADFGTQMAHHAESRQGKFAGAALAHFSTVTQAQHLLNVEGLPDKETRETALEGLRSSTSLLKAQAPPSV